jgi:hypothetical protein
MRRVLGFDSSPPPVTERQPRALASPGYKRMERPIMTQVSGAPLMIGVRDWKGKQ